MSAAQIHVQHKLEIALFRDSAAIPPRFHTQARCGCGWWSGYIGHSTDWVQAKVAAFEAYWLHARGKTL